MTCLWRCEDTFQFWGIERFQLPFAHAHRSRRAKTSSHLHIFTSSHLHTSAPLHIAGVKAQACMWLACGCMGLHGDATLMSECWAMFLEILGNAKRFFWQFKEIFLAMQGDFLGIAKRFVWHCWGIFLALQRDFFGNAEGIFWALLRNFLGIAERVFWQSKEIFWAISGSVLGNLWKCHNVFSQC